MTPITSSPASLTSSILEAKVPLCLRGSFSWQAAAQVRIEHADPEATYADPTWQTIPCLACQLFACPQQCISSNRTSHKDPARKYQHSQSQLLTKVCFLDCFRKEISEIQLTENAEIVIISKQGNKKKSEDSVITM